MLYQIQQFFKDFYFLGYLDFSLAIINFSVAYYFRITSENKFNDDTAQ
jgi:hypothetical protein